MLNPDQTILSRGKQLEMAIASQMNIKYRDSFDVGYYEQSRYIRDQISCDFSFDITSLLPSLNGTITATQWICERTNNKGHAGANQASRDIKEFIKRTTNNG
ncbi:MAG: hypothetical protein KKC21_06955 [Nitrospinae bacterium]|nr:hypothetical protein [Nitrospinota bacterium]